LEHIHAHCVARSTPARTSGVGRSAHNTQQSRDRLRCVDVD